MLHPSIFTSYCLKLLFHSFKLNRQTNVTQFSHFPTNTLPPVTDNLLSNELFSLEIPHIKGLILCLSCSDLFHLA